MKTINAELLPCTYADAHTASGCRSSLTILGDVGDVAKCCQQLTDDSHAQHPVVYSVVGDRA